MLESAPRLFVNEDDIKPLVQKSLRKNEPLGKLFIVTLNQTDIWERIKEAFETDKVQGIADKLGLSYQSVRKWKNGEAIGLDTLLKIRDLTGSSIDWLLTGEGSKDINLQPPASESVQVSRAERLLREAPLTDILSDLISRLEKVERLVKPTQEEYSESSVMNVPLLALELNVEEERIYNAKQDDPALFKRIQEAMKNKTKHRKVGR